MRFREFLHGEWKDVKGNAKYDAYKYAVFALVLAVGGAVWAFLKGGLLGLTTQQKWNFGIAFGLLLLITVVAIVMAFFAKKVATPFPIELHKAAVSRPNIVLTGIESAQVSFAESRAISEVVTTSASSKAWVAVFTNEITSFPIAKASEVGAKIVFSHDAEVVTAYGLWANNSQETYIPIGQRARLYLAVMKRDFAVTIEEARVGMMGIQQLRHQPLRRVTYSVNVVLFATRDGAQLGSYDFTLDLSQ